MFCGKEGSGLLEDFYKNISTVFAECCGVEVCIDLQRLAQFFDGNTTERGVVSDYRFGEDADAVGLLQHVHDRVYIIDERDHVEVPRFGVDETLDGVSVAQALFRQNEPVGHEVSKPQHFFLCQRVLLAHNGSKTILQEGDRLDELVRTRRHHGEHDVNISGFQHSQQVREAFVVGVDLHLGVARHEGEHSLADVGFQTEGETDVERAAEHTLEILDAVAAFSDAAEHLLGKGEQCMAAFCEHDVMGMAHKELRAKFIFEEFDLL